MLRLREAEYVLLEKAHSSLVRERCLTVNSEELVSMLTELLFEELERQDNMSE